MIFQVPSSASTLIFRAAVVCHPLMCQKTMTVGLLRVVQIHNSDICAFPPAKDRHGAADSAIGTRDEGALAEKFV